MYPVSEEYKKIIAEPSRRYFWTGTIITKAGKEYPFSNDDIVKGSGYITRQCSGSSEIELGTVYAAELGLSLFSNVDRYTLDGASITMYFHLELPDEKVETVPMGIFYVAEANRHVKTIELKAYDSMLNLDKDFNKGLSGAFPYDFLEIISKTCHVELAQTKAEIEKLPNGTELFGIYQDNDIETWRDFLHYLAQALGCFATIDREGRLLLVPYGTTGTKQIDSRHRFSSSFSDFVTRYTAINSTNKKTETAEYYSKEPDNGLTMNLGVNPLLQFGLKETRSRILNNILDVISVIEYVPFDSDTIGDPALDLGDVLQFTGGHADQSKCAGITEITTKINGKQSIKCVGKNPRLAEAKSKNDKNITGLLNSIKENQLSIYSYLNALALDVGNERTPIIKIEFASGDETNAEFHAECILQIFSNSNVRNVNAEADVDIGNGEGSKVISFPVSWTEDGKSEITVYYMLDGHDVELFHPKETWTSGYHLLTLYYPILELEANQLHTFEVLVSITNGKAHIDGQNIMATITGQGLGVQEKWDGQIKAKDTMEAIRLSGMPTFGLHENSTVYFLEPKPEDLSDDLGRVPLLGMATYTLHDTMRWFSPIVQDVVEAADRNKMGYNRQFVLDEDVFKLRQEYEISGGVEKRLDRGRMTSLVISTENFSFLTSLKILPFETLPFMNKKTVYAADLALTSYMIVEDGKVQLKQSFSDYINGVDMEINRGRLAAFSLGFENMETVDKVEVTNG